MTTAAKNKSAVPADALTGTHLTDATDPLNVGIGTQDKQIRPTNDQSLEALRDELNATVCTDTSDPAFRKFAADSEFMEGHVLVRILPSAEPHAEKIVDVYNNGTPQRFIRGEWTICRRKYVEVLARAKPFSVSTPEYSDGNGDRTTGMNISNGLRYPFEYRDKHPAGDAWVQGILSEA